MIRLFPITKVVGVLCAIFGALLTLIFAMGEPGTWSDNLMISLRYAAAFEALLVVVFLFAWRYLWNLIPALNKWVFPDIGGDWEVEIYWIWDDRKGVKKGVVHIKQTFVSLSMELFTDESESETLVAYPKRNPESGRIHLYYIYRNTPKNIGAKLIQPHIGMAILQFNPMKQIVLEGNYFTDRNTNGRFIISKKISRA
ncbi:MAG: hypothetical protein NPIRA05_03520 [Nitrospirales bacterium]|nr:MAG: hypothetical protein NPIRA05_03520 [Nitrospirales bacterium]